MSRKTTCPISREQFRSKAKPITITIGESPMMVPTKEFSTGSLGWYLNGKTVMEIDGVAVQVQLGLNLTIIGSKELPSDAASAATAHQTTTETADVA